MWLRITLTFLLLAACGLPADARKIAHTYDRAIDFEGKTRHYLVHVPNACKGKKVPLVILLHGGLTNPLYVAFESKMSQKSDRDNFIVVYPEGSGGLARQLLTWNAGGCCGPAQWKARNDVGFVREVIGHVQNEFEIDKSRIYVSGVSNGGMLAFRVASELADTVAAVASVNGCVQHEGLELRSPISVLFFNGSKDKVIRLNGGTGQMFGYKITCPDAHDTLEQFARDVGCSETPEKEVLGKNLKETFKGGKNGAEVCLYTVPISHFWPGGRRPFPTFNRYKNELSATDVMCDFFWTHPKKPADTDSAKLGDSR